MKTENIVLVRTHVDKLSFLSLYVSLFAKIAKHYCKSTLGKLSLLFFTLHIITFMPHSPTALNFKTPMNIFFAADHLT